MDNSTILDREVLALLGFKLDGGILPYPFLASFMPADVGLLLNALFSKKINFDGKILSLPGVQVKRYWFLQAMP